MQTKKNQVIPHTLFPRLPTPAPTPHPSTTSPLQADTQSSTLLRSRCPNHLNLPHLTTSATQLISRRMHKSSLCLLSFKVQQFKYLVKSMSEQPRGSNQCRRTNSEDGSIISFHHFMTRQFTRQFLLACECFQNKWTWIFKVIFKSLMSDAFNWINSRFGSGIHAEAWWLHAGF